MGSGRYGDFHTKRLLIPKKSGIEVYYTISKMLLVQIMLCGKLHRQIVLIESLLT